MDLTTALGGIGAAFGLASSAGLNAYIPLVIVALASRFPLADPWVKLAEPYNLLGSWWAIALLTLLLLVEVLVDKIPAVDSINDVIQTFIRPTAGAILFAANAQVITDISPGLAVVSGILLAGSVHVAKGAVRPVVTASTAGTGNWLVSIAEDVTAFVTSLLALIVPLLVGAFVLLVILWLIFWLWRRQTPSRPLS